MAHAMDKAGHSAHGLGSHIGHLRGELGLTLPAMFGVGLGLGAWIEKAKEATAEFGKTKRAVAATLTTVLNWDKGVSVVDRYRRSTVLATEITEKLEDTHARFGSNLTELGDAYRTISISAGPLRLTQKQLLDLTVQASAATKVYGGTVESNANRIGMALMGRPIRAVDAFGKAMYQALGGKGMSKMTPEKIFEKLGVALKDTTKIADEASQTMGDSIRRIHHQVEQLFEKIGAPVIKEISNTLREAAKYAESIGASGQTIAHEYGEKLVDAFKFLANASKLILDHWKEIALVWAGMKMAGFASGLGGLGGRAAGAAAGAATQATGALVGAGAATGYLLYQDYFTKSGKERREYEAKLASEVLPKLTGNFGRGDVQGATKVFDALSNAGVITDKGVFQNKEAMVNALTSSEYLRGRYAEQLGLVPAGMQTSTWMNAQGDPKSNAIAVADAFADRLGTLFAAHPEILAGVKPGGGEENEHENSDSKLKTTGTKININGPIEMKFNFEEGDPERVMTRFRDELQQMATRRTQSATLNPDVE